jgi:hypothetical protein
MSEREPYDPADETDDLPDASVPETASVDVPEADAIEQAAPVDVGREEAPDAVGDAPEADALEQRTEVADPDDDYRT